MIEEFSGTIGSGKSYHALERITDALHKGLHVIANFPLTFTDKQIAAGWADRYMFVDDRYFMGVKGIRLLMDVSRAQGWDEDEREGLCLVVIDEATNFFPKEDSAKPEQKLWKSFFTQTRKLGYDFILIDQDDASLNKTISKCIEYNIKHRKANNIFPFSILTRFGITIFFYNIYWKQQRVRLKSESSIFIKRLAKMYKSKKMFANLDGELDKFINEFNKVSDEKLPPMLFGNCHPGYEIVESGDGWGPPREGPGAALEEIASQEVDAHEQEDQCLLA